METVVGENTAWMNWISFWISVAANVFTSIMAVSVAIVGALFLVVRSRSKRLKVLGVSARSSSTQLPIYIAHLVITKGGALLRDGTPSQYFEGSAVPLREAEAATELEAMLNPGILRFLPESLRSRFEYLSKGFMSVDTVTIPAPLDTSKIQHVPNAIVIGGPEFNSATDLFLKRANLFTIVDAAECTEPTILAPNPFGKHDLIRPDSLDYNLGIVQRVTFDSGQVVVLLTGVGSNGTLAAVDWFLRHWDRLAALPNIKDFGVCLQCPKRSVDPTGYRNWMIRREYPEGILGVIGVGTQLAKL